MGGRLAGAGRPPILPGSERIWADEPGAGQLPSFESTGLPVRLLIGPMALGPRWLLSSPHGGAEGVINTGTAADRTAPVILPAPVPLYSATPFGRQSLTVAQLLGSSSRFRDAPPPMPAQLA
jgi:hypothetical protein